jgi:hypothetical protein
MTVAEKYGPDPRLGHQHDHGHVLMFDGATAFNAIFPNGMSLRHQMETTFTHGAAAFNDISKWSSSVEAMFAGATAFNGDISEWDVSVPHGIYMEQQRSMAIFPNGMSLCQTCMFFLFFDGV